MRAALHGCNFPGGCSQPANGGFLRPEASLGVIVLTDEDDCSVPPTATLFDPGASDALGPLTSYRCFQFGMLCDGADPGRDPGPRADCVPGTFQPGQPDHQLTPVEEFQAFLAGFKPDPTTVTLAVLAGPPAPVSVSLDPNGFPKLDPSCTGGTAAPALRLARLTDLVGTQAGFFSICDPDLTPTMTSIGALVAAATPLSWCLDFAPADGDPAAGLQADCRARTATLRELPPCGGGATPCAEVRAAPGCAGGAVLQVRWPTGTPWTDGAVSVECATLAP
jgi:hypothetical protein